MYFILLVAVHSILCIVLIGLVLIQHGKGADAGVTIGGGGGNTVFGAAGSADFLTKLTTSLAIGFMITSILMIRAYQTGGAGLFGTSQSDILGGSVLEEVSVQAPSAANTDATTSGVDMVEEGVKEGEGTASSQAEVLGSQSESKSDEVVSDEKQQPVSKDIAEGKSVNKEEVTSETKTTTEPEASSVEQQDATEGDGKVTQ